VGTSWLYFDSGSGTSYDGTVELGVCLQLNWDSKEVHFS